MGGDRYCPTIFPLQMTIQRIDAGHMIRMHVRQDDLSHL